MPKQTGKRRKVQTERTWLIRLIEAHRDGVLTPEGVENSATRGGLALIDGVPVEELVARAKRVLRHDVQHDMTMSPAQAARICEALSTTA